MGTMTNVRIFYLVSIVSIWAALLAGCGPPQQPITPTAISSSGAPPSPAISTQPPATVAPTQTPIIQTVIVIVTTTPAPTPLPSATVVTPTVTLVPTPTLSADTPEDQLIELANVLRQREGCPPLEADEQLSRAALGHAVDIATRAEIDHVGGDGATLKQRLERADYEPMLYGENIAAGYDDPAKIMELWTEGDENPEGPHRKNILNCGHTEVGIGLAYGSAFGNDRYPYWVMDLASPME